jgi:4-amino-4-deoxy-L-arabinose transferase-like glycosyltransferase
LTEPGAITNASPIGPIAMAEPASETATKRVARVSRRERLALGAILVAAAGVRLLWIWLTPVPPESDFATFYAMGRSIATGDWLPNSYGWRYQGPGYPLLLSLFLHGSGSLSLVRLVNVALQVGTVVCVWALGRNLFGMRSALLGAALAALFPGLWSYASLVAAENLAMLLLTGVAVLIGAQRPRTMLFAGSCACALAYTRPAYLGFVPFLALAVGLMGGRSSWWRRLGWYALGVAIVLVPLSLVNASHDGPVLPGGAAGWQLWLVNNERATGAWFPAQDRDDYPFKGLADNPHGAAILPTAERKLALQYVAANPIAALHGSVSRFRLNWYSDRTGAFWTIERASAEIRARVPLAGRLPGLFDWYYLLVLVLAATTALRDRRRFERLLPVLVPLTYVSLVLAVAEGNGRYHVVVLPLVCVLAGAALDSGPRLSWGLPIAAVIAWRGAGSSLGAWLIAAIVGIPVAAFVSAKGRDLVRWAKGAGRTRLALAAATAFVMLIAGFAGLDRVVDRTLAELDAVGPSGWQAYRVDPNGQVESSPPTLAAADVPSDLRRVSYPDAVSLPFPGNPLPGEAVGVVRTLTGLKTGATYHFYLQVYDPGPAADPNETLTVSLNGGVVWQRQPGQAEAAGWRYLSVPWVADGSAVSVRVERRAGAEPAASRRADAMVRNLHLYPTY